MTQARSGILPLQLAFRPAEESDAELLFRLLRDALGPYVTLLWGWDEDYQRDRWVRVFDPSRWQVITSADSVVGGLELEYRPAELYLANLLIFPDHQRKGIGTAVLRTLISEAHAGGMSVRLQVLKVNPARDLYLRLGFIDEGETKMHNVMLAPPPPDVRMPTRSTLPAG